MVGFGSPQLPRLVEEVLGASPLPEELVGVLSSRFRILEEYDRDLLT